MIRSLIVNPRNGGIPASLIKFIEKTSLVDFSNWDEIISLTSKNFISLMKKIIITDSIL